MPYICRATRERGIAAGSKHPLSSSAARTLRAGETDRQAGSSSSSLSSTQAAQRSSSQRLSLSLNGHAFSSVRFIEAFGHVTDGNAAYRRRFGYRLFSSSCVRACACVRASVCMQKRVRERECVCVWANTHKYYCKYCYCVPLRRRRFFLQYFFFKCTREKQRRSISSKRRRNKNFAN